MARSSAMKPIAGTTLLLQFARRGPSIQRTYGSLGLKMLKTSASTASNIVDQVIAAAAACAHREVLYEQGPDGKPRVTGLLIGKQGKQQVITADAYVAALDVPGAQRLLPQEWRKFPEFDNIYKLVGVPVITVQLR
eukprot:GHUV01046745.1.p1 GENE.GHUV01046745.1~~GHUV01046745.1.p1  ORF type:complete len:136 (-),score=26.34 GHUV01046745.1:483-890(-)